MAHYKNFVREGIGLPPVWEGLKYQLCLGNDSFIEKMQAICNGSEKDRDLTEIPRVQRRPIAKALKWYEKLMRAVNKQ